MTRDTASLESMLKQVDLFSEMSPRHIKALTKLGRETQHHSGHTVAVAGLGAMAFHLILSGSASVHVNGRQVRMLGPGDYFGEVSMIDGKPRTASVRAEEPMRTLAIHRSEFLKLLEDEPSVALQIMRQLCARLRERDAVSLPRPRVPT